MTNEEYIFLQDKLRKKLEHCNGLTGRRKEGFREAIKCAMSMVHCVNKLYEKENNGED